MAKRKQPNPLIGAQTKATVLDDTTKIDIDVSKKFVDSIISAGLSNTLDTAAIESFTTISNNRDRQYQLIDVMAKDSKVSSILRTLAEEACDVADNGHIVWCESKDPRISKFVNYLLNVMNVDKNIFTWTYCLLKYGDVYLRLYRESDYQDKLFNKDNIKKAYSARNVLNEKLREELIALKKKKKLKENVKLNVHKTWDPYSFYVEMIADPGTMFELTKYGVTQGYIEVPNATNTPLAQTIDSVDGIGTTNVNIFGNAYRLKSNDVNVFQADDFVHGCLEDNFTRYPEQVQIFTNDKDYNSTDAKGYVYNVKRGKSILIDSYKVWREQALLENSVLLNRVTKSSIIRNVSVEVGDMPKEQVSQTLRRVKEMMEQKSGINVNNSMSEYTNPGPIENNIYTATHEGKGAITVNAVGGDINVRDIADVEWWNDKFYSSYGVPKQYFGFCLGKDTEILLLNGEKLTIENLFNNKSKYIGKGIMACNSDGSLCPTKIANIMLTNEHAELLRIHLDNGNYVDVTPDHKMMLRDGTFVNASTLKEGDSLMPYYDKIKEGRRFVLDNKLGKFVSQHHTVAAAKGEEVELGYNIHHKNRNKLDDDFDNLIKLTVDDHCKEHNLDLAAMHKAANERRKANGEVVNANVGSKSITNGDFYQKLKPGEAMPDGFVYGGKPKSEETKQKISAARIQFFKDHPEELPIGEKNPFYGKKHSDADKEAMHQGQLDYKNSLTPDEQEKYHQQRVENGKKAMKTIQKMYMDKMEKEKPDVIRRPRKLRCPLCDKIFDKDLSNIEYDNYLNLKQLQFCCPEHRLAMDAGKKLARSYNLYLNSNLDGIQYEENRTHGKDRPDTFLKFSTLEPFLDTLNAYVPEVNHKVIKIEKLSNDNKVYDITVDADCHTFALPCGIFVHNCDDSTGFNGGSSLSIISSVFAKSVKRVQNADIQMLTDAINLILYNRGLKTYMNNFVLKMKAPLSQEELDYRANLTDRISAISNLQAALADVEDKSRRLTILKSLLSTLNYGDEILTEIDKEISEADKLKKEAEEEARKKAAEDNKELDLDLTSMSEEKPAKKKTKNKKEADLDLGLSSVAAESFTKDLNKPTLKEDDEFKNLVEDADELPSPVELNDEKDFTDND